LRRPYSFVTTVGYDRRLSESVSLVAEYLFARGVNLLRLRDVSDVASGIVTGRTLEFESTGRSIQHELMIGVRGDIGARFSMYGNYRLGRKKADTGGPYTLPAESLDLAAEYGPSADDRRHQIVAGATRQWLGVLIEPSATVMSRAPFNITTGHHNNGDTFFTDRPVSIPPGSPGAVTTAFGSFALNPQPLNAMIPRNFGRESWDVNVQLAVSKSLPQEVTVTAYADNLLNRSRLVRYNGVLALRCSVRPIKRSMRDDSR
jgi:hypothetical protein